MVWLKSHRPRVIHTDIMMPEMSGWDLVRLLKQAPETRDIPIVVVTAGAFKNKTSDIVQLIAAQLAKPISQFEYLDCISSQLAARAPHVPES